MASKQYDLNANFRTEHGKGPAGRLRREGRVPAILYGAGVDATPVDVDARDLYHALHTDAGRNVLIRLQLDGDTHVTVLRDLQTHAVRGDYMHVDFQAVSRDQKITAEVRVVLENEDDPRTSGGIVNTVLHAVPVVVSAFEVPSEFTADLAGMEIGDVLRVEDLADQLPADAEFDVELDRALVTINAPMSEEELEAMVEGAGIEEEPSEAELVSEEELAEEEAAEEEAAEEAGDEAATDEE